MTASVLRRVVRRTLRSTLRRSLLAAVVSAALPIVSLSAQRAVQNGGLPRGDTLRDDRNFSFTARGPYRPAVPTPASLLGYEIGARNTQYADQQRTLLAIADAARDRVRIEDIGTTAEGRRMRIFIISAPENINRLEAIKADLDRIADPRGASAADIEAAVARTPAVTWISESVHGNESPGFENAMALLYQLAASEEPATLAALKNSIVILNPSSNPDGHERFTVFYHSIAMSNPDNESAEHQEPWSMQGRFNHYRFDMNRDLIAITQREVQAITGSMLRWHPMITVDQHGHTVNYYFAPAARPINANVRDESTKWLEIIGRGNAAAFDKNGWMYFTRNEFDLFYPGYYDTWPSLTGATGMTYETDGGGHRGMLWRRDDGSLLSLRDGISKHFVSAMATIETTASRSTERVRDYAGFRRGAIADGSTGMRRVVFDGGKDPVRAAELAAALLRAGIEVRRTTAPLSSLRATAYADDVTATRRWDAGVYVVDLAQPMGRLAKAVLEPRPLMDSVFVREQIARFQRNQRRGDGGDSEGYEFYDITAWSLPVAYGVQAWHTSDAADVTGTLLTLPAAGATTALVNGERLPVSIPSGVEGARATSAYLFTPEQSGAAALAYHLLADGYRVSVGRRAFESGSAAYPRGTFVVRVSRNEPSVHARIDSLARQHGVRVATTATAFPERSQFGIGDGDMQALRMPRIAVVGDEGISQTSFGALWWTMETRYRIPFTHLGWRGMRGDLSRFDVLIMPEGSAGSIANSLGKPGADAVKAWVQAGGTLITMGSSSLWAAREDVNITSARRAAADDAKPADTKPAASKDTAAVKANAASPAEGDIPVASPSADPKALVSLPGSHFDAVLDRTHWLTAGYEQPRITALVSTGTALKLAKNGTNIAVLAPTGLLSRAGFTFPDNSERALRGTPLVIEESVGRGHAILFLNEPTFRGWWRAFDRMLLQAIVIAPSI